MKEDIVKQLHDTLIEILDYVVAVCEENDLTYTLVYGTALGACRHKGFIPWDDDLDIGMPREDYDKFIKIMEKKNNELYSIQYEGNEDKYYLPFAKVRKNGTLFAESIAKGLYKNNGIFIDIFPLDRVENIDSVSYKIRKKTMLYLKHILRYSTYKSAYANKRGSVGRIVENIICIPAYIFSRKWLLKRQNSLCIDKKANNNSPYIAQYEEKAPGMILPSEWYFPLKKMEMCGKEYNVPNNIEKYLSTIYGDDYMELPPEDKRVTHLPEKIRF